MPLDGLERIGMGIDFRVLGPLEIVDDGVSVRLGGPRPRALLAALLVETDRFVSRDRLIDELWGDEPPATAENSLQAQVAALRLSLIHISEPTRRTPTSYAV